MKTLIALVFLMLITVSTACSQEKRGGWREGGTNNLITDNPDQKAVNGFGGHLIIVKNPGEFVKEWLKPEMPNITTVKEVLFSEKIGACILFAGCKQDAQGICNTEVDYLIYKPDGSLLAERKAQPLWKEKAPPVKNTQLGRAILAFSLPKTQPSGEYKVKAKVYDLNADISFELETIFLLKE